MAKQHKAVVYKTSYMFTVTLNVMYFLIIMQNWSLNFLPNKHVLSE